MVTDVVPLIVMVPPVLLPVVRRAGMSPPTFKIVPMFNRGIGLTTPSVISVGSAMETPMPGKCTH